MVEQLECTYGEANINSALQIAEKILEENSAAGLYLFTDKQYEENEISDITERVFLHIYRAYPELPSPIYG